MTEAEELEEIKKALAEVERSLSGTPRIASMEPALYVDSSGYDAARITVTLEDPPGRDLYDWKELKPIRDAIFEAFQQRSMSRWPYVDFQLQSELAAEEPEDEDLEDEEPGDEAEARA